MCWCAGRSRSARRPGPDGTGRRPTPSATGSRRPVSRSQTPPTARNGRCWMSRRRRPRPAAGTAMAGNSRRRGAVRKPGTKKGPTVGSGGVRRRGLEGRGATPPAHMRPNHPAAKRAAQAAKAKQRRAAAQKDETEIVLGRNPVVECLRAEVPATALYVALGTEADERLTEAVRLAADAEISILEVPGHDLDRVSANGLHQGIALQVPPYQYAHPDDLLERATTDTEPALLVALDNISDPRNLGAIVRSVAAFAGH